MAYRYFPRISRKLYYSYRYCALNARAHTHTWILRKDNSSWVTLCDSRIQMEIGILTSCILSFEMICSGILEHGNASWRILRYHHNFWSCNASLPLCSTLQKYTISFILHHSLFVCFFLVLTLSLCSSNECECFDYQHRYGYYCIVKSFESCDYHRFCCSSVGFKEFSPMLRKITNAKAQNMPSNSNTNCFVALQIAKHTQSIHHSSVFLFHSHSHSHSATRSPLVHSSLCSCLFFVFWFLFLLSMPMCRHV